jgi:signal transduction histidine kinase
MFRVKGSEQVGGHAVAETVLQVALLFALLANVGSAYLTLAGYRRLGAALDAGEPMPLAGVASLRGEVVLQMASSLALSAVLAACAAAVWWLRRRYVASQGSLRRVKMLAHDVLASMDRGVVTTDPAGVVMSINSSGIRLLGVDFDCVGRPLAAICPAGVPLAEVYREVVAGRGAAAVRDRDFEAHQGRPPCRTLRLRVDGHPLRDVEGAALGCVIHLHDVTERRLLEERMRRMERFIGLASLASGLHHEIKNPLTALSIHVQLLAESLASGGRPPGEEAEGLVGVIETEVSRLEGVLESFRSFAHLQRLTVQPSDALEVVRDVLRLVGPQAAGQGVRVTLSHVAGLDARVPLDAEKVEQALLNLVLNALEAMPEGGDLTVLVALADGEFRVSVKDTGPGIAPEIQPNLFQPYFSTKTGGSGMGLALSEKLIGQHGGQIAYRTGPEGTTFDVTIPITAAEDRGTHE